MGCGTSSIAVKQTPQRIYPQSNPQIPPNQTKTPTATKKSAKVQEQENQQEIEKLFQEQLKENLDLEEKQPPQEIINSLNQPKTTSLNLKLPSFPKLSTLEVKTDKDPAMKLDYLRHLFPVPDYQSILAANKPWKDKQFRPQEASFHDKTLPKLQSLSDKFQWRRARDVIGSDYKLFKKISPTNIKQGQLGDCYFLATLAALAEFPSRVQQLFLTKEINEAGVYAVKLFVDGLPIIVVVDQYLPYDAEREKFAFCHSEDGSIWAQILEKALAKVFRSGDIQFALRLTTGALTSGYDVQGYEPEKIFEMIQKADKLNEVMTSNASKNATGQMNMMEDGLVDHHVYSLIDAFLLETERGTVRLLKLRNPWGRFEWKGNWSDQSDLWTPELKQKAKFPEVADDGIFYMQVKDFVKYFDSLAICHILDKHTPIKGSKIAHKLSICDSHGSEKGFTLAHLIIQEDKANISIEAHLPSPKIGRYPPQQANPSAIKIALFKYALADGAHLQIIKSSKQNHQYLALDSSYPNLAPGDYIIMLKNTFVRAEVLPTTLSVIASHQNIYLRQMKHFDSFPQHAIYASKWLNKPAPYAKGVLQKTLSLFNVPLFLGLVIKNTSSTATAYERITFVGGSLAQIPKVSPPLNQNSIELKLSPSSEVVAALYNIIEPGVGSSQLSVKSTYLIIESDAYKRGEVKTSGKKTQLKNLLNQDEEFNGFFWVLNTSDGAYFLIENNHPHIQLTFILTFKALVNQKVRGSSESQPSLEFELKQGQSKEVFLDQVEIWKSNSFSFEYTYSQSEY